MRIEKAEQLGLCFGVRRAVKLLRETVSLRGGVETLGPVAHNRMLVETLARAGVKPVNELSEVRGKLLAITTHGIGPAALSEIEELGIEIIDTTCPIVRRAQRTAGKLAEAGFDVVIFGEGGHSEVKGLLGYAGDRGRAALDVGQAYDPEGSPMRLGIISQTTQAYSAFAAFAAELVRATGPLTREVRLVNTLCQVTQRQQDAALSLARRSELMLVIGGRHSANTGHLVEICSSIVETHLVETADEIDRLWLKGKEHVGITAGASTPDEAVEAVIARLGPPGS